MEVWLTGCLQSRGSLRFVSEEATFVRDLWQLGLRVRSVCELHFSGVMSGEKRERYEVVGFRSLR